MAQYASRHRRVRAAVRRAQAEAQDGAALGGELNIVPFLDIIVNVLIFLLATVAATLTVAQVEVDLPSTCAGSCSDSPGLGLNVAVTDRGVVLAGLRGGYAPGCVASPTHQVTVPRRGGAHDLDALRACLERLHRNHPSESQSILTADGDVPYEEIIAVMDALRGTPEAPLFPVVRLSAGLR